MPKNIQKKEERELDNNDPSFQTPQSAKTKPINMDPLKINLKKQIRKNTKSPQAPKYYLCSEGRANNANELNVKMKLEDLLADGT